MANLLLHSLKEFDEIIFALLERAKPRSVLEIGSETGAFSDRLMRLCEDTGAELVTVEPEPAPHLIERALTSERFHLYKGLSLPFLEGVGCRSEFVLIDGDHNHHTVFHELMLIERAWAAQGIEGTILLHDVGWPCARRDAYYGPGVIPPEALHAHSYEHGTTLDRNELIAGGFRGCGAFAWAKHEGGPRNGVRTAVDDFLREHPRFVYNAVDAVFGLGAVTVRGTKAQRDVDEVFAPYDNALIRRLERNRLELYLKVIELQDALDAERARHAPANDASPAIETAWEVAS